jgi:CTP:molybdopterin cytidylyltransferase MocA
VLFPFAFADHVERLGPHEGLNRLLERLPTRACEWPAGAADEALPGDLDTPADYAQALAALRASPRSHSDQAVSGGAVDSDGSRC